MDDLPSARALAKRNYIDIETGDVLRLLNQV